VPLAVVLGGLVLRVRLHVRRSALAR
jgi:hypothetical protein